MPLVRYVSDNSRFKDIVRFTIDDGSVCKAPHGDLFHPVNAASYGHAASRSYSEIPLRDIEPLSEIVEAFGALAKVSDNEGYRDIIIMTWPSCRA